MAITKLAPKTDLNSPDNFTHIQFICPVCKTEKSLKFPKTVISQAKGLTTMSIAGGLVCKHQFQAFVDKNFMVRGYQKVDFEFEKTKSEEEKKEQPQDNLKNDKKLFENLILEGDFNYDNFSLKGFLPDIFSKDIQEVVLKEPTKPSGKKYDHIIYRGLKHHISKVIFTVLTDHFPVYSEFKLPNRF